MDVEQLLAEVRRLVAGQAEPLTVSVEEAAKRLGVSPATIRRMLVAGLIQSVRIGKRRMVPMSELRRLAEPVPAQKMERAAVATKPKQTRAPPRSQREEIRALNRR